MTRVYLEKDGDRYTISAKEHATGSAIMCACISTLIQAAAAWAHNAPVAILTERITDGDCLLIFKGEGDGPEAAFMFSLVGFLGLQKADNEHISVNFREI